jgi:hypothetical protein
MFLHFCNAVRCVFGADAVFADFVVFIFGGGSTLTFIINNNK